MAEILMTDPAADVRDEIMASSGVPEPLDKIWFHKTAAAVIDADRCVGCGSCIAACPSRSLTVGADGTPTLVRMCTGCSACWDYCPLAGLRVEKLNRQDPDDPVGEVRASVSARAAARPDGAQDGGVVTTLLATLMERGFIDGAVLTLGVDAFVGTPVLATSPEAVRGAAGSVYHQSHTLTVLNEKAPAGVERIAFVGTPCQISGLRALQRFPWGNRDSLADKVVLAVGLFCTRSFDPKRLIPAMAEAGVDLGRVRKIDVRDGRLVAAAADGEELLSRPVREFSGAALRGCDECADFAALGADLVVGNVGSDQGASTVLVRTYAGMDAWVRAAGTFDEAPMEDLESIRRLAAKNLSRAQRSLERDYDPDGPLWISYEEHLTDHEGTDRAPASPPRSRSHHYTVAC